MYSISTRGLKVNFVLYKRRLPDNFVFLSQFCKTTRSLSLGSNRMKLVRDDKCGFKGMP